MTGPDAAILAAIITAFVALLAIVGSIVTTRQNLRHQQVSEDKRREHERDMRLLDSGLKAAIDFLAAADRATGAMQALQAAEISLDAAKSLSDQQAYDEFRQAWMEARDRSIAAVRDARDASAALRLLVPPTARPVSQYLELCIQADAHPDAGRADRDRARQAAEEAVRQALGAGLPDDEVPGELASHPKQPTRAKNPTSSPKQA